MPNDLEIAQPAPFSPDQPHWSLMTKTRNGTVSIMRGLTLREAARAYERMDPFYGEVDEIVRVHEKFRQGAPTNDVGPGFFSPFIWQRVPEQFHESSEIVLREVFGPPGWNGFKIGDIPHRPKRIYIFTDEHGAILSDEFQPDRAAAMERRLIQEIKARDSVVAAAKSIVNGIAARKERQAPSVLDETPPEKSMSLKQTILWALGID